GVQRAWMLAFACAAVAYVLALAWGLFAMPRPRLDASSRSDVGHASNVPPLLEAVASYFWKPRIAAILAFIVLYRLGESMLTKMSAPFLMGKVADGGMALSTTDVGVFSGTIGVAALVVGGVTGGWLIARV